MNDLNDDEDFKRFKEVVDLFYKYMSLDDSNDRLKFASTMTQKEREEVLSLSMIIAEKRGEMKEFLEMVERAKSYAEQMNRTEH